MDLRSHDIGAVEDFKSGMPRRVQVDGRALVVVRNLEEFHVLRDTCPHQGARLSDGRVGGVASECEAGRGITYERVGEILTCPWHGWEYDLQTGRPLVASNRNRVRTFRVQVESGRVFVFT